MKRLLLAVLFGCFGASLCALGQQDAQQLKPADQDAMAKLVANYFKALEKDEGTSKAFDQITELVDKWDKRKGALPSLSLIKDWERIFASAQAAMLPASAKKGINTIEFEVKGDKYRYSLSVPKDYAPKSGGLPLLLCLPDATKKPQDFLEQAWTDADLRAKCILAVVQMPAEAASWTEMGAPGRPGGLDTAMRVLNNLRNSYALDPNRIFLVGLQGGAGAASKLACVFPHIFAGVIVRGGDIEAISAANFRNLPSLWIGGGGNCTAFQTEADTLGYKNCTVDPAANEQTLLAWIQSHPRIANPTEITIAPMHTANNRAYWVQVDRFDPAAKVRPHLQVSVDRAANKITFVGDGIEMVNVSFNDAIVDLSKPVELVLNGASRKVQLARNLKSMLQMMFTSNDAGRVYTKYETFDLPKPQNAGDKKSDGSK